MRGRNVVEGGPHTTGELRRVLLKVRSKGGAGALDVDDAVAAADPDRDGRVLSAELVAAVLSDSGWSRERVRDVLRGCA